VTPPLELIWAIIGLLLTIGCMLLNAFIVAPNLSWTPMGIQAYSLGVTLQLGAVLLSGCVGGKNAGALSQIAYLVLGLSGMPIFGQGGGLGYIYKPNFGYLLGFVPGAWLCGWVAFRVAPRLEGLALSCLCGLLVIHGVGLLYLVLASLLGWMGPLNLSLGAAIAQFTLQPLLGHIAVACAAAVVSLGVRRLLFY
jgi:biotin transport system substrate-specific component